MRFFLLLVSIFVLQTNVYSQLPVEILPNKEITLSFQGQNMKMKYFSNGNLDAVSQNNTIAIINLHGILKYANLSLKRMLRAADLTGNYEQTIVVAPQFMDDIDVGFYNLGPEYLYWNSINASSKGSNSANTLVSVSSYTVIDEIINTLIANNPNLCQIVIAGHSSGGQMAMRYAAINQSDGNVGVPIRYIVSNPSSYLYMDNKRVIPGSVVQFSIPSTTCANYNNWKYGLDNLSSNPYANAVGISTIRNQFKDREVHYLLGALDNNPAHPTLDISCSAMLQGNHRLERGNIYYNYIQQYYMQQFGVDITSKQSKSIVQGVAHSSSGIVLSPEGLSAIFNIDATNIYDQLGWQAQTSPVTSYFLDTYFTDSNHGWSCGTNGKIIKTVNGGQTWQNTQVNGTVLSAIRSIYMINNNVGWACRSFGKLLKTVDGGNTWDTQSNGASNKTLRSILFTDSNNGWAVGSSGAIIHTTNGGLTWVSQNSGTTENLYHVYFINSQIGWAVGANGTAIKTVNGGATWNALNTFTSSTLRSVYFTSTTQGWIVGLDGIILRTINGGSTWTPQVSTTDSWLRGVSFNGLEGWAVGSNGKILHTYDGGDNWIQQESGTIEKLSSVFLVGNTAIVVGDNGTLLRSESGGHPCFASVNLGPDIELTSNEVVVLSSSPNCYSAGQVLWSTGATTPSIEVSGNDLALGPNAFTVELNTAVNCSVSDDIVITLLPPSGIELHLKVFLQGPYNSSTLIMNDHLRQGNDIPLVEPYTALGFDQVIGGGETITPSVLNTTGNDAIVDWVFIELRSPINPSIVLATQSALVQRDGDVVGTDGFSYPTIDINISNIIIAVTHRNHFGVRTLNSFLTSSPVVVDFTSSNTMLYGLNPMNSINGIQIMVSGDANKDGAVNAVDKNGYWQLENGQPYNYIDSRADFNMDGVVNPVDKNGFWHPNNSRIEQY